MTVDTVLSIMMLACLGLLQGAYALWRRGGQAKQVWLMVALAAVVAGNLAIWMIPGKDGKTLAGQQPR